MRNFRDLAVWQEAHGLVLQVHRATTGFPPEGRYGLTAQIRRTAASIATNIAEGCGRDGEKEMARFLAIASGSASETEYQVLLARDLEHLTVPAHDELHARIVEVKKMLNALHRRLTADS